MITRVKYDRFTEMYTAERKWFLNLFWTQWFFDPEDKWVMRGHSSTRESSCTEFIAKISKRPLDE